jgi:hypothetical protein
MYKIDEIKQSCAITIKDGIDNVIWMEAKPYEQGSHIKLEMCP